MINHNTYVDGEKIAKKKFGQNFLKDETILRKIIESMPDDEKPIVEIGPGLGDLTRHLVKIKDVTAYEVDKDLCERLCNRFKVAIKSRKLTLRCTDVLTHWNQESLNRQPYHIVANLPYYIATNIILRALKDDNCQSLLVMVQKEVAKKFSAKPKQKSFSALAVLVQSVGEAELCFDVLPEAFVPAPKVVSSVLRIVKKETFNDSEFENFLKAAFAQPRKTLAKNLFGIFCKEDVAASLDLLNLRYSVRPHEVCASLYHRLYKILKGDIDEREKKSRKSDR